MKYKSVIVFILVSVLLAGCSKRKITSSELKNTIDQSPVIVYANADTNHIFNNNVVIHFVITDFWKGSGSGIIGTEIALPWPPKRGPLPDGAIIFYQTNLPATSAAQLFSSCLVKGGRVAGMTVQEFRTKYGL
jgi:hypothetical protein